MSDKEKEAFEKIRLAILNYDEEAAETCSPPVKNGERPIPKIEPKGVLIENS